ncbi:Methylase involved in ubiquinone/menaquinone biosynthesis [Hyella patelloides LEGE 07179]|uniref:Methylase involved in ubiquinone/menaquinone biosynthesis n=1 Tax=Hyella patelloides LEGE 07179 TaxID=945734 RepID=A0A563VZW7_9CYAN|nr:class I SAM-dependent methyltransferase [Hyella patelloides]VEP16994.1 Methylase involved in ubiquinone/menaquinone biosynthesis [Hyella patelloides LEGE 07179]
MNLIEVKDFLRENINEESEKYFGVTDSKLVERVTNNWFNDQNNYDGRWQKIIEKVQIVGKVLDMASGCGTFTLFGLQNGYDVWGIEPEKWKREYFKKKVIASNYPEEFLKHLVEGVGESLPFDDASFDVVTTYQTLEHVKCVSSCIQEMLRVLKPGGILYIKCPNYDCFFEPHYRILFLPKMNKKLAAKYLKIIGKPTLGLQTLQWTTEAEIINLLNTNNCIDKVEKLGFLHETKIRHNKIINKLPEFLRINILVCQIDWLYKLIYKIYKLSKIGRQENHVNLWATKVK